MSDKKPPIRPRPI